MFFEAAVHKFKGKSLIEPLKVRLEMALLKRLTISVLAVVSHALPKPQKKNRIPRGK